MGQGSTMGENQDNCNTTAIKNNLHQVMGSTSDNLYYEIYCIILGGVSQILIIVFYYMCIPLGLLFNTWIYLIFMWIKLTFLT